LTSWINRLTRRNVLAAVSNGNNTREFSER
jgi:hypothetical protein